MISIHTTTYNSIKQIWWRWIVVIIEVCMKRTYPYISLYLHADTSHQVIFLSYHTSAQLSLSLCLPDTTAGPQMLCVCSVYLKHTYTHKTLQQQGIAEIVNNVWSILYWDWWLSITSD